MNAKNITRLGAILTAVLFLTAGLTEAEVRIVENPHYSNGDYFIYDVDPKGMVDEITEKYGNNANVNIYHKEGKLNVSEYEDIYINNTKYRCIILFLTIDIKFNFSVFSDQAQFNGSVHILRTEKRWIKNNTLDIVKEEIYQRMDDFLIVHRKYYDTYDKIASEDKTVNEYSPPLSIFNLPVYAGKTWESNITKTSYILHRYRDITTKGKWISNEVNTTEKISENFSAPLEEKIETKLGDFDTLLIKKENGNEECYMTSNGIPVKIVIFKHGEPYVSLEITEYKYAAAQSSSNNGSGWGLPGFGTDIAVLSLLTVLLAYGSKRRR